MCLNICNLFRQDGVGGGGRQQKHRCLVVREFNSLHLYIRGNRESMKYFKQDSNMKRLTL